MLSSRSAGMAEIHAGTAAADVDRALFSHVGAPARWRGVSSLGIFKKRKSAALAAESLFTEPERERIKAALAADRAAARKGSWTRPTATCCRGSGATSPRRERHCNASP